MLLVHFLLTIYIGYDKYYKPYSLIFLDFPNKIKE